MDCEINAPGNEKNVFDGLNSTEKRCLNGKMELLVKWTSNDTSKIGILPSTSNNVSINFAKQCLKILANNDRLNGLKGGTKIQGRESLFQFKPS